MSISLSGNYRSKYFKYDLIAGLTVAVMLVPQGMAYAVLAGLPPIYGLYAALVPLLIYPFFGSSNFLSVGPVALVSILVLSGLSFFAEPMSAEFIQLAILTSLIAGIFQVLMSLLRLGFLVNFLSHPVISGFTSAAAFIIAFSQLNHIFGVEIPRATNFFVTIVNLIKEIPNYNLTPALIGLGGLAIIMIIRKIKRSFPSALLVVLLSILIVRAFGLDQKGLSIVGDVPSGFPLFETPAITLESILKVTPVALIICLISFIESLAIAKTLAARHSKFDIDSNKELMGLGLAKIVGSFFQAFPNTGSFTRSAINEQSGARTGMASIFASVFIGLTLLLFTDFFYYLPNAILAAIVISAVFSLIDVKEAKHLFYTDRQDFMVLMITFLFTLGLGVQQGVFFGIGLSALFILYRVSIPHYAVLGKLPDSGVFKNALRFKEAEREESILIIRYDDDIFFGNSDHFRDCILSEINKHPKTQDLVLDISSISFVDSTGLRQMKILFKIIKEQSIKIHLTGAKGIVRDIFRKNNIYAEIGEDNFHFNIQGALDKIEIQRIN